MALKRNRHEEELGDVERASWVMRGLLAVFFIVALIGLYKILPLEGNNITQRGARKMFAQAQAMDSDQLYRGAAQYYTRVSQSTSAKRALRSEAAERLSEIYAQHLDDPHAARAALEEAWFWAVDGERRNALRARLDAAPDNNAAGISRPETPPRNTAVALRAQSVEQTILSIGNDSVTVEEILFAWQEINGRTPPEGDDFEAFVQRYLDMVLLAGEAERLGLADHKKVRYDLKLKRVLALNNALTEQFINDLPDPGDEALEDFRRRLNAASPRDRQLAVSHIVVDTTGTRDAVLAALDRGEPFNQVARNHSLDAAELPDGCRLGRIDLSAQGLNRVGPYPGLAPFLARLDDGETTGPVKLRRGWHWFRLDSHLEPPPEPPLSAVRENVLLQYQQVELARQRQALLKRLHDEGPVVIHAQAVTTATQTTTESSQP